MGIVMGGPDTTICKRDLLLHCSNDNNNVMAMAGVLMCFFLPFYFQDIPTYCLTLTMLVLCLDRHQSIRHPEKAPMPITWILGLVWFVSIALVLPYMAYIKHFDLSVSKCYLFVTYLSSSVVHSGLKMEKLCNKECV